jgi:hypothetical protein
MPDKLWILSECLWTDRGSLINKHSLLLWNIYRGNWSLSENISLGYDTAYFITLSMQCWVSWCAWQLRVWFCSITVRINARRICAFHSYRREQVTWRFKGHFYYPMIKFSMCGVTSSWQPQNSKFIRSQWICLHILLCLRHE